MKFCSSCGAKVVLRIPEGDNLPRYICETCGEIHYQNPKIVAGCIPEWQDKILLCKRAIEPRHGLWTLPAGFMENKETTPQAALRETLEEANARAQIISLFALYNIPHISQVYIMFRAKMTDLDYKPGTESLDVELFSEDQISWDDLAFPVIKEILARYFKDRLTGKFNIHVEDVYPSR